MLCSGVLSGALPGAGCLGPGPVKLRACARGGARPVLTARCDQRVGARHAHRQGERVGGTQLCIRGLDKGRIVTPSHRTTMCDGLGYCSLR
jgi:hypothetical protein